MRSILQKQGYIKRLTNKAALFAVLLCVAAAPFLSAALVISHAGHDHGEHAHGGHNGDFSAGCAVCACILSANETLKQIGYAAGYVLYAALAGLFFILFTIIYFARRRGILSPVALKVRLNN